MLRRNYQSAQYWKSLQSKKKFLEAAATYLQRDKESFLWNSSPKAMKPDLPQAAVHKTDKIRRRKVAALETSTML